MFSFLTGMLGYSKDNPLNGNQLGDFYQENRVFKKDGVILVVEVKTRRNFKFGWAEESISEEKIEHIHNTYQILQQKLSLAPLFQLDICIVELLKTGIKIKRLSI